MAKRASKVKKIPTGYHSATPYLIVDGAERAPDFSTRPSNPKDPRRGPAPGHRIGHAEIKIGDSVIMLADEHPEIQARGPQHYGGSPVSILLYVDDVDSLFRQAVAAGATETRPVANQFYGARSGSPKEPFGHTWHLSTHQEDVSPEELNRRVAAMAKASTA